MGIAIKPSDLKYKYPRDVKNRDVPKFVGKPDKNPFNRDDLFDIIPMLEAAMDELGREDALALHTLEDLINNEMPRFIATREETFDFLVGSMRELLR